MLHFIHKTRKEWAISHQNGDFQCLFHGWKYLYIFPDYAWVTQRAVVILVYCHTSGQMGSCTARAYVSVSTRVCVCAYVPGNCQFWHDYLRRGPSNTAVPRYGCHSNIRRKWLTGRLMAVHVRSAHEMRAYASSSAYMLSLTSTTKEISHHGGRFMWILKRFCLTTQKFTPANGIWRRK